MTKPKEELDAVIKSNVAPNAGAIINETMLLDIGDVIFFLGHHRQVTGIQRVVCSFIYSINNEGKMFERVEFVAFSQADGSYHRLDKDRTLGLFERIRIDGNTDDTLEACLRMAQGHYSFLDGRRLDFSDFRGATFCILGAAWMLDIIPVLRWAKNNFEYKLAFLIYDLIPLRFPQYVTSGLADVFRNFVVRISSIADVLFTISEYVATDLSAYLKENAMRVPKIVPLSLGKFEDRRKVTGRSIDELLPTSDYVLFVSTIEIRKNHRLLFQLWQEFLREGKDVPDLVFVGRMGWKIDDLVREIDSSDYLNGKLHILSDVSDQELGELYRKARFLAYPSFCEGWGLPVTEALSLGTPVLSSNTTSLPEAGGGYAKYLPPDDKTVWRDAILDWLSKPSLRSEVDLSGFTTSSWDDVLRKLLSECNMADYLPEKAPEISQRVLIAPGAEIFKSSEALLLLSEVLTIDTEAFKPNEVRIGPNWSFAEIWGHWATRGTFRISCNVSYSEHPQSLLIFLQIPDQLLGERVICNVNGRRSTFYIRGGRFVLCIGNHYTKTMMNSSKLDIEMKILDFSKVEALIGVDARMPSLGFEAITLLNDNDLPAWSIIMTTLPSEGRKLVWLRE